MLHYFLKEWVDENAQMFEKRVDPLSSLTQKNVRSRFESYTLCVGNKF